jgi:type IV pilus assembly protein PilB
MLLHPDAEALIRAFLDRPLDETPRLVLADWLDDTGLPADAGWAAYLRTRCRAARLPAANPDRPALLRVAVEHAAGITTTLSVPAGPFTLAPESFLDLLPADRPGVTLGNFLLPAELTEVVPESVARTCRVVSLSPLGERLFLATADPADADNRQRLEFILNREIVFLRAAADDIDRAIDVSYPFHEVESVTEELLDFRDPPVLHSTTANGEHSTTTFIHLVLLEAVRRRASWVEIRPESAYAARVWFRVEDAWHGRDTIPRSRLGAVVAPLAEMSGLVARADGTYPGSGSIALAADGIEARFTVVIEPTPFGRWVGIKVMREPAPPVAGP